MFELHYEYICAAGWREHKTRTLTTYGELETVLDYCRSHGYEVLDNPLCVGCVWKDSQCAGSKNHIWTGCKKRMEGEELGKNEIRLA